MTRPVLHATNLSSRRQHGPGKLLCAMARPRPHEREAMSGWFPQLAPPVAVKMLRQAKVMERKDYNRACHDAWESMLKSDLLTPGKLVPFIDLYSTSLGYPAKDGDTIFCACARPENRKEGSIESQGGSVCHLERVARWLVAAGWDVMLFGRLLTIHPDLEEGVPPRLRHVVWADDGKPYPGWVTVPTQAGLF